MIAVWIVGGSFLVVGLLYSLPTWIKFIKCKGRTKGVITNASRYAGTGDQPIRASYEYYVDGVKYTKSTGWTNYGVFRVGRECDVRYNLQKPNRSYIKRSGMLMKCAIGTMFAIVGAVILCLGVYLMMVL